MKTILYKNFIVPNRRRLKYIAIFSIMQCAQYPGTYANTIAKDKSQSNLPQETQITITGKIKDDTGRPMIGVGVLEKGSANGTVTDSNGEFTLKVKPRAVLVISYIGYLSQEISISNQKSLEIVLKEDQQSLDEVLVVGYGTMKKKDLTGAVSTVKGDDLAMRKTTQLSTALQGATSGVLVTRESGAPGATASVKIRGVTTIGETSPLVIVDGVPGDINQINPNDVESLTVLKDAASASIYGSRAAAGVIVITTKRAADGSLKFNYNFNHGWEMPAQLPQYVNATRYLEMTNEIRYNDNHAGGWFQTYSEAQINDWLKNSITDPDKYPNVDWQKALLKSYAPNVTHSINVSGGGKSVRTNASFRYDKADAIYDHRYYERFMIRVNNDFTVNKYLKANLDFNFKRTKSEQPNQNPIPSLDTPPIYAIRWTNGMWGDVKDGGNTLAAMTDGGNNASWNHLIGGKAGLDLLPFDGLKISAVIAPNFKFDKSKIFLKKVPYTYADDPNKIRGYVPGFYTTKLQELRNDDFEVTTQFFGNYTKTLGKHDFSGMVGYEDYYAFWEELSASRDQYGLTNFPYLDIGPEALRDNTGNAREYAYRSVFGRLTYSYDNRYLFQANFRRDGSSRFAKDNRWGNFPSFSAGWVLSEENFMKKLNMEWLSLLKFRGSWGKLGNERISSLYPYQASVNFGNALLYSGSDIVSVPTASQQTYAVRNITWETTETWDAGLDAHFLNSKLRFTADLYKKKTKDMLIPLDIPKFIGYDNPSVNAGKMHTTGYDLEMSWNDKVNDFSYSISANFSDFISKMGDLRGTEFLGDQIKRQGGQFNEWYGFVSDGLFLNQADLDNSAKMTASTKIGDVKYKDISGPNGVPDGIISAEYDRVLLGGSLPRHMFGINLSASYKGFDCAMVFQGVGSQNVRITEAMIEPMRQNWKNYPQLLDGNYWTEKNTDAQNAEAKYPRLTMSNKSANLKMSDFWMFNGRYLRMKNLTLGYTIPTSLLNKVQIKHLRFYVAANDLFSLNNYPKGWDPESAESGYPITKSVLFGLSIDL